MNKVQEYNKTSAAVIGGLVAALIVWANGYYGLGWNPELVTALTIAGTAVLVYAVPNVQRAIDKATK